MWIQWGCWNINPHLPLASLRVPIVCNIANQSHSVTCAVLDMNSSFPMYQAHNFNYPVNVRLLRKWLGTINTFFYIKVRMERGMYMYRCSHCTFDNDCMHTTDDGADQTAFGLPHFSQVDKATAEGLKYKVKRTSLTVVLMHLLNNYVSHSACLNQTKLYGAITHGVATNAYILSGYMPGGSNLNIEIFHR